MRDKLEQDSCRPIFFHLQHMRFFAPENVWHTDRGLNIGTKLHFCERFRSQTEKGGKRKHKRRIYREWCVSERGTANTHRQRMYSKHSVLKYCCCRSVHSIAFLSVGSTGSDRGLWCNGRMHGSSINGSSDRSSSGNGSSLSRT